jgi:hypothetical protein
MTLIKLALLLVASALAAHTFAQQPAATGGTVVASEPGRATIARAAELSAQVVGLDKATRTVTLKGPKGKVVDIVAGDESRTSTRSSSATSWSRVTSRRSRSS